MISKNSDQTAALFNGCPAGYTSLGGVLIAEPSTIVFNGRIYVFGLGTDNGVYYQYSSGGNFTGWLGGWGTVISRIALSSSNSNLYVEGTGTDNNRWHKVSADGDTFSGWNLGSVTTQTNSSANFNGNTYNFVKGEGSQGPLCVQIASSNTNSPSSPPPSAELSRQRLLPKNQTGSTNLYSRNFGWGTGLAGLSGRELDAGFGISYNSLVWTRVGGEIVFNPNNDNVSPGFRFGYPVIEPPYADPLTGKNTFLMVTPSGSRAEFRQVTGSSDTYETVDSTYIQLKTLDANNLQVTGTDGTSALYQLKNGVFRCAWIKDSNGNFVTVNHDANGLLQTVTDTLGRVFSVSYDGQNSPISVTQQRASGTFTFATLTYASLTISTNFSGLSLVGISNGASIKVLQKITYADGSFTQFDYNSYGQVWRIANHAADNHKLNHTAVNLDSISAPQTDCPRFTEIRSWVENFNLDAGGTAQEIAVPILYQENASFTLPSGAAATGTLLQTTAPDGAISKTFVGASGWMEGVPILTEDWANNARQRWSYSAYTQDDPNLSYVLNPRVIESKIGDNSNVRRTTVDYLTQQGNPQASYYGLTSQVKIYDADQTTVLKRSTTEYNLDQAYLSRRIIGLPQKSELYDQNNALMSKVTYGYDEGNFAGAGQTITPIQHDTANFGAGFVVGRGNVTSTTRWDVTAPADGSKAITARTKYNTAGAKVASIDPLNREVTIGYADSFDDNQNRNTFAYPTSVTDPAGNSSYVKYRFDLGANVFAQSPAPAGQSVGKQTQRNYDALGRLEKETVLNTGAYTRYEYPLNGIQSKVFSTVTDVNSNGAADAADEVVSEALSDGAGRTRMSRTEHPGSDGGWSATLTEYDAMGRVRRSTVPTEVNSAWTPAGDDAARGWLWSAQEYDWKGRVTRQINTDGTDKLISYEGCGCAGGQVTTVSGEQLAEGRRRQKVYEDILGRTYKTETLNWDGSVYSTAKSFFNGRDQVTLSRHYAGADTSSVYQDTTMTYDGHGRLKTQHRPEQAANTATVYNYYPDDRIQQVIDARGATVNYQYDSRGLTTQVSSTSPNLSAIPVTPTVTYAYDSLGNRTQMTDGLGNVVYEFNQLSQLTAETRQFNDSLPNAPLSNNRFKLEYGYNLSGQLNNYKDPYGQQINYSTDKVGRLTQVFGSTAFDGVTNYASNASYRAWGSLKSLTYGSGMQMNIAYNNRLQSSAYTLAQGANQLMNKNYHYYADGSFRYMQDGLNPTFDRLQNYDHLGRLIEGKSGAEARGQTVQVPINDNLPYRQSFVYDAFDNMIQRNNLQWGRSSWQNKNFNINYDYNPATNRIGYSNYQYDAEGRITYAPESGGLETLTDASGAVVYSKQTNWNFIFEDNMSRLASTTVLEIGIYIDGNGKESKRLEKSCVSQDAMLLSCPTVAHPMQYFIRSSVFGNKVLTDVNSTGQKLKTFIIGGGNTLAWQTLNYDYSPAMQALRFEHWDVSASSRRMTDKNGGGYGSDDEDIAVENDPLGGNIGLGNPYYDETQTPDPGTGGCPECKNTGVQPADEWSMRSVSGQRVGYSLDGIKTSLAVAASIFDREGGSMRLIESNLRRAANEVIGYRYTSGYWVKARSNQPPTLKIGPSKASAGLPVLSDGETPYYGTWSTKDPIYSSDWGINTSMMPNQQRTVPLAIVGFSDKQYDFILKQIKFMENSTDCKEAFTKNGLLWVNDVINKLGGLTIVNADLVGSPTNNRRWGGNTDVEPLRKLVSNVFDNSLTNDVTPFKNFDGYPIYPFKGRYYSFIRNKGLRETEKGIQGEEVTSEELIVHVIMHVGGAANDETPITTSKFFGIKLWSRTPKHDLEWMNYRDHDESQYIGNYDDIIKKCIPAK